jgi:hypothetical protein
LIKEFGSNCKNLSHQPTRCQRRVVDSHVRASRSEAEKKGVSERSEARKKDASERSEAGKKGVSEPQRSEEERRERAAAKRGRKA